MAAVAKRDLYQTSRLDVSIEIRPDPTTGHSNGLLNLSQNPRHASRPALVTSRKGELR